MEYSLFKIKNFPSPTGLTALIFVLDFSFFCIIYTLKNNFITQAHIKFITEKTFAKAIKMYFVHILLKLRVCLKITFRSWSGNSLGTMKVNLVLKA